MKGKKIKRAPYHYSARETHTHNGSKQKKIMNSSIMSREHSSPFSSRCFSILMDPMRLKKMSVLCHRNTTPQNTTEASPRPAPSLPTTGVYVEPFSFQKSNTK